MKAVSERVAREYAAGGNSTPLKLQSPNTILPWRCSKGHLYHLSLDNRVEHNISCPHCNNQSFFLPGFNDMLTLHPRLAATMDPEKNAPESTWARSNLSIWWRCSSEEHSYSMSLGQRLRDSHLSNHCNLCSCKTLYPGYNDLATHLTSMGREATLRCWAEEKNSASPEDYTWRSGAMAHWICPKGHPYEAVIRDVTTRGRGCPYCSGRQFLPGVNDLATLHPELAEYYDEALNPVPATMIYPASTKVAWWRCENGESHSYQARFGHRIAGSGCGYCAGAKILHGFNDLSSRAPHLAHLLDGKLHPHGGEAIHYLSQGKLNFLCGAGHRWRTSPAQLANVKIPCPYCGGRKLLPGFNDLATTHPEMLTRWNYGENAIAPDEVMASSGRRVSWICVQGHSSIYPVSYRVKYPQGCKSCSTSAMERELSEFIQGILPGEKIIINDREIISPRELDIYLPNLHLAVEFNGEYWHGDEVLLATRGVSGMDHHGSKVKACAEKGVRLLYVWESDWLLRRGEVERALVDVVARGRDLVELFTRLSGRRELGECGEG